MKKQPVVALGIDAGDPVLLEKWMDEGELPHFSKLLKGGGYGRLENIGYYKAETPWTTFLTGCMPLTTEYWTPIQFQQGSYRAEEVEAYDFHRHPPFYAIGDDYRVAIFDVPQTTLSADTNGPQVLAWGAHSPQTPSHSSPAGLLDEINEKYGKHPALHKDHGAWWDREYLHFLLKATLTGIERRTEVVKDWLKSEPWDLLLTVYGETHSTGHDFWHLSDRSSPLYQSPGDVGFDCDPMLEVFKKVDNSIGCILSELPDDGHLVVFSVHGSGNNVTDVPSMVFLPELMYRFSFPGCEQLAPGTVGDDVGDMQDPGAGQWQNLIYGLRRERNIGVRYLRRFLPRKVFKALEPYLPVDPLGVKSIKETRKSGMDMSWQPSMWYAHLWPKMKAFALPSFSEGYVRINVEGREPEGIVSAADYQATCDELAAEIRELRNPRTGGKLVKKVVQTRTAAELDDPSKPGADLVVVWNDDEPADVCDHSKWGRVGPVPYRRSGSHRARGFWAAIGPRIQENSKLPDGHAVDLAPTILDLMGASPKTQMDGKSLFGLLPR